MSFVDEVQSYLDDDPRGVWEIPSALGCAFVESEVHDERRWYNVKHTILQRKTLLRNIDGHLMGEENEYVLIEHCEPATEMQEDGDFPKPQVFAVEPYQITVTKFRPC